MNTCSAIVSFLLKIEEETAKFYEDLAKKYVEHRETFLVFNKENKNYKKMVERTYYGVISDALEACFSFGDGLDTEAYKIETEISKGTDFSDILLAVIKMEEIVRKIYTDAAELSDGLMADVPRTLRIVANKRNNRISKLKTIIKKA